MCIHLAPSVPTVAGLHVCMHVCMCVCVYVCMYVYVYVYVYVCACMCLCVCICVLIHSIYIQSLARVRPCLGINLYRLIPKRHIDAPFRNQSIYIHTPFRNRQGAMYRHGAMNRLC